MALLKTDIVDWALDQNGDIVLGQDVAWSSGLAATTQSCRVAVQMIAGEWFLDDTEGVPYFERPGVVSSQRALLGRPYNSLQVIGEIRDALLSVPQVIAILSITPSFTKSTGRLSIAWSVRTTFGDTAPETAGPGGI